MEAIGSELNLFEPPVTQSAIEGENIQEFGPLATIIQGAPIDFQIEGGGENYIDLNNTKLEVRAKLTMPDGTNIAGGTRVGVVNLPLHSMFESVRIKIADKVVTETNNMYPYRALMETLLNYEKSVLDTRLKCEGYEEDLSTQMDDTDPAGGNTGLGRREAFWNASRVVRLIGRLHSDLFHQEKLIPAGIKLDIQLVPSRPTFFIKTAVPQGQNVQVLYKLHIVSARFLVQFKQVSKHMAVSHLETVGEVNYQIPHTKVLMKTQHIPQGVTNFSIDNIFKGKLPDRVALAMVSDAAMTGSYNSNPFNFEHFGVNYMSLLVNSQHVPRIPYEPDFQRNDYLREYLGVLEAMGYDIGPYTWSISPSAWATGYNFWVYKVTPGPIGAVRSKQLTGDIRLEMKFRQATNANITLIVLSEEPATLEIDKFNHVLI